MTKAGNSMMVNLAGGHLDPSGRGRACGLGLIERTLRQITRGPRGFPWRAHPDGTPPEKMSGKNVRLAFGHGRRTVTPWITRFWSERR